MKLQLPAFILLFLSSVSIAFGQESNSDFFISEVVKVDSVDSVSLFEKGFEWFNSVGFKNIDKSQGKISGTSEYNVYQRGVVSNQIHGTISYTAEVEVKNSKYRYTFKNFVYHYHKQDRYGKMVPTGKKKPLSEPKAEGWQKTWDKHKAYTEKQINILIASLRESMQTPKQPSKKREEDF
jgi:hypothetical protein